MNTATLQWHYALAKSELRVANVLKRGQGKAMGQLNKARAAYHRALSGKPALKWYPANVPVDIAGIPALVCVEAYEPGTPYEGMRLDYIICDSKGYEAPWLEAKANRDDVERQILDWKGDDEVWL